MIKLTLLFKDKPLKVFPVTDNVVKIGRADDCDIVINNLSLSPLHAIVEVENDDAVLIDKSNGDETAGVFVNSEKVKERKLEHNDIIVLGKYSLKMTREEGSTQVDPKSATPIFSKNNLPEQGWLQFTNGPKLGRTIKLDNSMMRLGKAGKTLAMISGRDGEYFAAHLEGEPKTKVSGREIGDERVQLKNGDMLKIGETQMMFFVE